MRFKNKDTIFDIGLLFILTLGFFWRVLFENKFLFFGGDLEKWYFGLFNSIAHGGFLNIDTGFRALEFIFVLHFFMTAVFTYFLTRFGLNLHRLASILAATAFAFSGIFVTHVLNFPFFYSVTWLPLIFLLYLKSLKSYAKMNIVLAGIIMGLSVFTGSSYGLFYTSLIIVFYFIYGMIFLRPDIKKIFISTFLVLFIGWSIYLQSKPIFNEGLYYIQLPQFRQFIISVFLPNFYSRLSNWWEFLIYPGISVLVLAGLSLVKHKDNNYRFFLALAFISLIIFLGLSKKGFLLDAYLNHAPTLDFFNYPSRMRIIFNLSLSIMAGYGLDAFLKSAYFRYTLFICVILFILAAIVLPIYYTNIIQTFDKISIMRINALSWLFLILFINAAVMLARLEENRSAHLLAIALLALLVIDIFSFWADINPKNYGYGQDYDMPAPSIKYKL